MSSHCHMFNDSKQTLFDVPLLYISEARYENDWLSAPHTHNFTELFYVLDGEGTFTINQDTFPIRKDDFIVVNSTVLHTEDSVPHAPLHYIVIGVDALQLQTENPREYSIHNFKERQSELSFCFMALLKEIRNKDANYEAMIHHYFQILMEYIRREMQITFITDEKKEKVPKACRFIEQYLHDHYKEGITLQTLSELTFMNKHYLAHSFRKHIGVPPMAYLTQIRVREAKFLLETTDLPLSKIAAMAGFSSQSYFSQVFKKETDLSANEYRKRCHKES